MTYGEGGSINHHKDKKREVCRRPLHVGYTLQWQ